MIKHKVSVVIPVYNGEAFIARAINSVLSQSLAAWEIIVINDGSKDGTAEQLLRFGNQINVMTIPNGGVSNARNKGMQISTGDFIAFLDADDVWYPHKLKKQLEIFEQYADVGFCCCNFEFFIKGKTSKTDHFHQFKMDTDLVYDIPQPVPFDALVTRNFVGTCSNVMIRKQVLNRIGFFDVSYKQSEDYDLWLRCAVDTEFVLLEEVLLEKKSHDSNLTNDFLETLLYHEKVLCNLPHNPQTKQKVADINITYKTALAVLRYEIGNLLYEQKRHLQAFNYFFKGLFSLLSLNNFKRFIVFFGKKLLRTMSFGLVENIRSH